MTQLDLAPAARRMSQLVVAVPDARLGDPTPCQNTSVADLLDHINGLSIAFAGAARKANDETTNSAPRADGANLESDWRAQIPRRIDALADAWRPPDAWQGMTRAGSIDMPGEIAGIVALDELVIHGWDLARALGADYDVSDAELNVLQPFVQNAPPGLFAPPVPVAKDAPLLARVIGLAGRDPGWRA
jgi:uncharacterized protein (TIGR03086 family)